MNTVSEYTTHKLKCWPEPYEAIRSGDKTLELRKNDRGFRVGDVLRLQLWDPEQVLYLGAEVDVLVTHFQTGFGLPADMVAMSIRRVSLFSKTCAGCQDGFYTYDEAHTHCSGCL